MVRVIGALIKFILKQNLNFTHSLMNQKYINKASHEFFIQVFIRIYLLKKSDVQKLFIC